MYGLPILRQKTSISFPKLCYDSSGNPIDPPCGDTVRLATPLSEMRGNHFTSGVALDWRNIIAWGSTNNIAGTLGTGGNDNYPRKSSINRAIDPILKTKEQSKIIKLRSFAQYSFFLTEKGYLYASGNSNMFNTGSSENRDGFELVTDNVKAFDLCSSERYGDGNYYILIVKNDGRLYGMGTAGRGYGIGSTDVGPYSSLQFLGLSNIVNVFCNNPSSQARSFAIDTNGYVWACGYNSSGCLGVNSTDAIVSNWTRVIKSDGTELSNVKLVIPSNFVENAGAVGSGTTWGGGAGHDNTSFLTNDGFVYTAGNNNYGQLGLGLSTTSVVRSATKTSLSKVVKMASSCGGLSVMVSTSENQLYSWGNNHWGQLGHGDTTDRFSPTLVTNAPTDLIVDINGGGHYGIINGTFVVMTGIGDVYGAGFDETYALGIVDGSGHPVASNVTTLTKNPFFGPNPTMYIDPSDTSARYLAIGVDLCGYGTEVAQKVVIKDGTLFMSGWNQEVSGIWNFNPKIGTQNVYRPSKYVLI
jgi:hypothetical protein